MTELEGTFHKSKMDFPIGTFHVDMAQPLANLIFYCLEPEIGDGLVGWNYFNDYFTKFNSSKRNMIYPVFKYLMKNRLGSE